MSKPAFLVSFFLIFFFLILKRGGKPRSVREFWERVVDRPQGGNFRVRLFWGWQPRALTTTALP